MSLLLISLTIFKKKDRWIGFSYFKQHLMIDRIFPKCLHPRLFLFVLDVKLRVWQQKMQTLYFILQKERSLELFDFGMHSINLKENYNRFQRLFLKDKQKRHLTFFADQPSCLTL